MILLGLFFSFGIDLYLRKNPNVTLNNIVSDNYEYVYVNNSNATLAYRIEDVNRGFYKNSSIIQDFILTILSYQLNSQGEWELLSKKTIQPKMCKDLPNIYEIQENYDKDLTYWYCIDFNEINSIGGNWDGNFLRYLRIDTPQCTNSTSNNYSCASFNTIQNQINNKETHEQLFFSYLYMRGIAKVSNVSYPIGTTLSNIYDALDVQVTKRKYQTYKKISLESDNGWIFPQKDTSMIYCLDTEISDFVLKDPQNNNLLHRMTFYFGKNKDSYSRSFTKIQEVFAQIGGFSSVMQILLSIIYKHMGIVLKNKEIMKKIRLTSSNEIPYSPIQISIKNEPQKEGYDISNRSAILFEQKLNKDSDNRYISSIEKKIET